MTDDAEWGPWIEHDGLGCPCAGQYVHCKMNEPGINSDGVFTDESYGLATGNPESWVHDYRPEKFCKVIRYRIRKPRALKQLRDLVENLPAPTERVDA